MDEDLEFRQALNRHVTRQEPPFALTAESLVAAGRRRERWRVGITYGAGSVATVVTITGALTLLGTGGNNTASTVDDVCGLPLAVGWQPPPSRTPGGTRPSGWPTGWPSGWPTALPTVTPTGQQPTAMPTGQPTQTPTLQPTSTPTELPPSGWPSMEPPYPTKTGPPLSPQVSAATCLLANEIRALLPEAKYARSFDMPPLALHQTGPDRYLAQGIIVGKDSSTKIIVTISPREEREYQELPGWKVHEKDGTVIRSLNDGLIQVEAFTGRTHVYLSASGPMLTVAQLERLASAPELALIG